MKKTTDTSDPLAFFQLDMTFHNKIVVASGNEPLIQAHNTFNARLWRARFISSRQRVNRPGTLDEHQAIAEALQSRDASACSMALKAHLQSGYNNIKSVFVEPNNEK